MIFQILGISRVEKALNIPDPGTKYDKPLPIRFPKIGIWSTPPVEFPISSRPLSTSRCLSLSLKARWNSRFKFLKPKSKDLTTYSIRKKVEKSFSLKSNYKLYLKAASMIHFIRIRIFLWWMLHSYGKIFKPDSITRVWKGKNVPDGWKILERFSSNEIHYDKFLSLKDNWNDTVHAIKFFVWVETPLSHIITSDPSKVLMTHYYYLQYANNLQQINWDSFVRQDGIKR